MRALVRTCGIVLVLVACSFASSRAASDDLVVSIAPSSDQPPPIAKIAPESTSRAGRPKSPIDDRASTMTAAAETAGTTPGTFSVDAFQNDLFTGAATAEIPIVVPAGAAGVAPKIALRYSSGAVDEHIIDRPVNGTAHKLAMRIQELLNSGEGLDNRQIAKRLMQRSPLTRLFFRLNGLWIRCRA